eukprot:PLAT15554.3.p1 GENE.PLAT15554.3~~PLAT15554.3.p1  ORF type:complete len:851 (+),score=393.33 PLAT15554.3:1037-3589(+)
MVVNMVVRARSVAIAIAVTRRQRSGQQRFLLRHVSLKLSKGRSHDQHLSQTVAIHVGHEINRPRHDIPLPLLLTPELREVGGDRRRGARSRARRSVNRPAQRRSAAGSGAAGRAAAATAAAAAIAAAARPFVTVQAGVAARAVVLLPVPANCSLLGVRVAAGGAVGTAARLVVDAWRARNGARGGGARGDIVPTSRAPAFAPHWKTSRWKARLAAAWASAIARASADDGLATLLRLGSTARERQLNVMELFGVDVPAPALLVLVALVALVLSKLSGGKRGGSAGGSGSGGASGKSVRVASKSDLAAGEMRSVSLGGARKTGLLCHTSDGSFHTVSGKCTHSSAPLAKGVLNGDTVVCPWHAAKFNVVTGEVEDGCALDCLDVFPTSVRGDDVFVEVPEPFPSGKRRPEAKAPAAAVVGAAVDGRTFVIIGSGAAGAVAAETLRMEGFAGSVVVLTDESQPPYDRVKLSKSMGERVERMLLRPAGFYEELDVEMAYNHRVIELDAGKKSVTAENGRVINYDACLVAPGGKARVLRAPGWQLDNIFTLRYPGDSAGIEAAVTSGDVQSVVIIGSSFIGMEAAAYLRARKKIPSVTVVGMEAVPFERVLGGAIGAAMQTLHEGKGIHFRMSSKLAKFESASGAEEGEPVSGVRLECGDLLEAQLVIIGAGIIPATEFLEGSGVDRLRDGSVVVDSTLAVPSAEGLFIAGDVARFPYAPTGSEIRCEHWDVAMQQGRIAARNMLGAAVPYTTVPFFWSGAYGKNLRYAGHATEVDDILFLGDVDALKFVAFYVTAGAVAAVAGCGADKSVVAALELLQLNAMPTPAELLEGGEKLGDDWQQLLPQLLLNEQGKK